MPELPEVEVLRRSLERRLPGQRIARVEVREARLRERVSARSLAAAATGRRVVALARRGKYLLVHLEGERTLVIHLGMSGRLTVAAARAPRPPHEHVAFHLAAGGRLRFVDPRRFGLVLALRPDRLAADPHFAALGVEPLGPLDALRRHLPAPRGRGAPRAGEGVPDGRRRRRRGGEHLRQRGAAPGRHRPATLGGADRRGALGGARHGRARGAGDAIEQGGTTLNDFVDGEGNPGYFQVALAVYDREGEPCRRCGAAVRRIVQAGRSTYLCPRCQR